MDVTTDRDLATRELGSVGGRPGEDLASSELIIERLVVFDVGLEMRVLFQQFEVLFRGLWRSEGGAASGIKMPLEPGLPDVEDAGLPFGGNARDLEANAKRVLLEHGLGVFL